MNYYNLSYKLKGPGGELWVPSSENPIEAESVKEILCTFVEKCGEIPTEMAGLPIEFVGIKVEKCDE